QHAQRARLAVVADDEVDLADVEPLLADRRGDEHVELAGLEALDGLELLALRHALAVAPVCLADEDVWLDQLAAARQGGRDGLGRVAERRKDHYSRVRFSGP